VDADVGPLLDAVEEPRLGQQFVDGIRDDDRLTVVAPVEPDIVPDQIFRFDTTGIGCGCGRPVT
jgi:hypothetical protein